MYENVGGRSGFEIRRSLGDSMESRVSSPQDRHPGVPEHKPSDFEFKRKNKFTEKRFKRRLTQDLLKKTEVEFIDLPRNEQIAALNSYGKFLMNAYILNYIQEAMNKSRGVVCGIC